MQVHLRRSSSAHPGLLFLAAAVAQRAGAYHLPTKGVIRQAALSAQSTAATDSGYSVGKSPGRFALAARNATFENDTSAEANLTRGIAEILARVAGTKDPVTGAHRWGPPIWWHKKSQAMSPKESFKQFWEIPIHKLVALVVGSILCLVLDQLVVQVHVSSALRPLLWVSLAMIYVVFLWSLAGADPAVNWLTGYLYEFIFQIDNLMLCHIIFKRFEVPKSLIEKALNLLLCGQLLVRLLFYLGLAHIVHRVVAFRYIAGLALVYGGYAAMTVPLKAEHEKDEEEEQQDEAWILMAERWLLQRVPSGSTLGNCDSQHLSRCVSVMILADLVLGADCAIAKIEEIPAPFSNLMSSAAVLFALRASYHLLAQAADNLVYLQQGIGAILVFIGIELMLMSWVDIGAFASMAVYMGLLLVSVVASLLFRPPRKDAGDSTAPSDEDPKEVAANLEDTKVPAGKAG